VKIPVVHYSLLARDAGVREELGRKWLEGRDERSDINKSRPVSASASAAGTDSIKTEDTASASAAVGDGTAARPSREAAEPSWPRRLHNLASGDAEGKATVGWLKDMPVVVCVAMYRTNGMLEKNVELVGRTEGVDLWNFS